MKKIVTPEFINRAIEMRKEGLSQDEIANELGCSNKTVSRVLCENGMRSNKTREQPPLWKKCPKCHRGPFPADYVYCPYCTEDIRTEREKLIELLSVTLENGTDVARMGYAMRKAIAYLEGLKDV